MSISSILHARAPCVPLRRPVALGRRRRPVVGCYARARSLSVMRSPVALVRRMNDVIYTHRTMRAHVARRQEGQARANKLITVYYVYINWIGLLMLKSRPHLKLLVSLSLSLSLTLHIASMHSTTRRQSQIFKCVPTIEIRLLDMPHTFQRLLLHYGESLVPLTLKRLSISQLIRMTTNMFKR